MTTITTHPAPVTTPTWGRIGEFGWDLWEGERRRLYAVCHGSLPSPLAFFTTPADCAGYIGSGDAAAGLEKRSEEKR